MIKSSRSKYSGDRDHTSEKYAPLWKRNKKAEGDRELETKIAVFGAVKKVPDKTKQVEVR